MFGEIIAARRTRNVCRALFLLALLGSAGAATAQVKGDASRGTAKAAMCGACHGTAQSPPLAGMPTLSGQQSEFLVLQMFIIREGLRDVPQMTGMLKGFTDQDLTDVAAYFAAQALMPVRSNRDSKLQARGDTLARTMGCASCHLSDFSGQRQVPRITHQREDYLVASMQAYRDNKRVGADTNMNAILSGLTDADIHALAHYLAHFDAKR